VRSNLVAWVSGNASARVPGRELTVIKPSGVVDLRQGPEEPYLLGCHFKARMSGRLRGTGRPPKAA
jgi:hypothetical protein